MNAVKKLTLFKKTSSMGNFGKSMQSLFIEEEEEEEATGASTGSVASSNSSIASTPCSPHVSAAGDKADGNLGKALLKRTLG